MKYVILIVLCFLAIPSATALLNTSEMCNTILASPEESLVNLMLMKFHADDMTVQDISEYLGFSYMHSNVTRTGLMTSENGKQHQIRYIFPFWQLTEV